MIGEAEEQRVNENEIGHVEIGIIAIGQEASAREQRARGDELVLVVVQRPAHAPGQEEQRKDEQAADEGGPRPCGPVGRVGLGYRVHWASGIGGAGGRARGLTATGAGRGAAAQGAAPPPTAPGA